MKKIFFILGSIVIVVVSIVFLIPFEPSNWKVSFNKTNTLSSPRAVDLNEDGILDIVFGAGGREWEESKNGIMALNGKNGDLLWKVKARNQISGSAIFQDINRDGIKDVFIGGRSAQLYSIDGSNGNILWEFLPYDREINYQTDTTILNFFSPQWLPDQNKDGYKDLIISFGGFVNAAPSETDRPVGKLMVISGKDGALLASAEMPDGKETYFSPIVHDFDGDGNYDIIFGSGGETIHGSLFRAKLSDLMKNNLAKAIQLASGNGKGFIAPALLTDVTNDSIKDIIVNSVNGRMLAYDGVTNHQIWKKKLGAGIETYSTPVPVYFRDQTAPLLFASFGLGTWPDIISSFQIWVDGETGETRGVDTLGTLQYSSPIVCDLNGDQNDDVLFNVNILNRQTASPSLGLPDSLYTNKLIFYDLYSNEKRQFEHFYYEGTNLAITPLIVDLDANDHLDLIFLKIEDKYDLFSSRGITIERFEMTELFDKAPTWGGYMGNFYKGY